LCRDFDRVLAGTGVSATSIALISGKANHTEQLKLAAAYPFDPHSNLLFCPSLREAPHHATAQNTAAAFTLVFGYSSLPGLCS